MGQLLDSQPLGEYFFRLPDLTLASDRESTWDNRNFLCDLVPLLYILCQWVLPFHLDLDLIQTLRNSSHACCEELCFRNYNTT